MFTYSHSGVGKLGNEAKYMLQYTVHTIVCATVYASAVHSTYIPQSILEYMLQHLVHKTLQNLILNIHDHIHCCRKSEELITRNKGSFQPHP